MHPPPNRVLFTGAAGTLGRLLLPRLESFADHWRLVDKQKPMPAGFTDCRVAEIGSGHESRDLLKDVDAVVHFAAQSKPAASHILRRANVETVAWLLESMKASGVRRLVYASSMHVVGMFERTELVAPDCEPRPDGSYGESKRRAEALIQQACASGAMDALILRIGHATQNADEAEPGNWLAIDDLVRLIEVGLTRELSGAVIVHAVTPHRGDDMGQNAFASRFAMRWNKAPAYRDAMQRVAQWYGDDPVARRYRGGVFASGRADAEFGISPGSALDD